MIFKSAIKNIFKTSIFAGGITFLVNLFFLANVNKPDYGIYLIIIGLFAFSSRLLQGVDDVIIRFFNEKKNKQQNSFFITSLIIKIFLTFVAGIIVIIFFSDYINSFQLSINIYSLKYFILIIFIFSFILCIKQLFLCLMYSCLEYDKIYSINLFTSVINAFLIIVLVSKYQSNIIYFIWINITITSFQLVYYFFTFSKIQIQKSKNVSFSKYLKYYFKEYYVKYGLPISISHGLGYFNKDHGPNVFIGTFFGPEILAIISICKTVFEFIHNFVSNVLRKLYPVYFHYNSINAIKNKIFKNIFLAGNLIYILIGLLLLASYHSYFNYMNIENNGLNFLIYLIFAFEFIFKFTPSYLGISIPTSKDTRGVLYSNFFRSLISLIFIFIGIFLENVLISLAGITFGIIISIPLLLRYCPKNFKIKEIKVFFIINFLGFILLINHIIN